MSVVFLLFFVFVQCTLVEPHIQLPRIPRASEMHRARPRDVTWARPDRAGSFDIHPQLITMPRAVFALASLLLCYAGAAPISQELRLASGVIDFALRQATTWDGL